MARISESGHGRSNRARRTAILHSLVRATLLLITFLGAGTAGAANFNVNSTGDSGDATPGDGTCWTGAWVMVGQFGVYECTLRAAIEETNYLSGADSIGFSSLLNPNVYGNVIIAPFSAYPVITSPLTIDGTTIPEYDDADPNAFPVIVLDGSFLGGSAIPGLTLGETADGSVVRALTIIAFPAHGISLGGADSVLIEGNHIGLDRGFRPDGNGGAGIYVYSFSTSPTIGKELDPLTGFEGRPNVISANATSGVVIHGNGAEVAGNLIGADPTGNAVSSIWGALGNGLHGVEVVGTASNATIGDAYQLPFTSVWYTGGNVIAGNGQSGIRIQSNQSGIAVHANQIGVGADGTTPLGNAAHGILMETAYDTTIGEYVGTGVGLNPARGNHIAHNGDIGVLVSGHRNAVRGNVFGSNGQLAIDLAGNGPTANDYLDEDGGPNWLQNTPVLDAGNTAYDALGSVVYARYLVDSWGDSAYPLVIDFHVVGPDGVEPGAWIGSDMYEWPNATLDRDVAFTPAVPLTGSETIVAIATDADGNSSEVGNVVPLPEPGLATGLLASIGWLALVGRRRDDGLATSAA